MKAPRPLSLVKLRSELEAQVQVRYPFSDDMPMVFLGEIPNMPEHGVFVGFHSGKVYSGYHVYNFVELASDEV
jgi:hypothetical protein